MASPIEIKIDATRALARFSPSGIPEAVRRNLRQILPGLGQKLGALVNTKLDTELKSRRRVNVVQEMRENPNEIYVIVAARWTGPAESRMVPQILESGAKPHLIAARSAKVLSFFWPKLGRQVFFKQVNHPGFAGIRYMERSLAEMRGEIEPELNSAVISGMNE